MRYVIIRDDDTNALTPVECLERLYRPFLDRGLPINLAVIPEVSTAAKMSDGKPEGFLLFKNGEPEAVAQASSLQASRQPSRLRSSTLISAPSDSALLSTIPIASNQELVQYLRDNVSYEIVQHGYHHDYLEFDSPSHPEIAHRLDA